MLVSLLDLGLKAGAALSILAFAAVLFARAPRASLTLMLVAVVLEGSRITPVSLGGSFGPIYVSWADVATALMGAIGVGRLAWRRTSQPARGALLLLVGLVGLGLVAWTAQEGLETAVNFWRPWTFGLAAALYVLASPRLATREGTRPFVWAALLASVTQVAGYAQGGFGSNTTGVVVGGELVGARPVTAAVALLMLIGMVFLVIDGDRLDAVKAIGAGWLGVSIIAAQHRSVWVAASVAGVTVLLALTARARQRMVAGTLGLVVGALLAAGVAWTVRSQAQLSQSASSTGTFQWRLENWTYKLSEARSLPEWVLGSVFGPTPVTDPDRVQLSTVSSHSMYVESVVAIGLIGALLVVVLAISATATAGWRNAPGAVVVTLLAYGLFYQWPGYTWFVLGAATLAPQGLRSAMPALQRGAPSGSSVAGRSLAVAETGSGGRET